MSARTARALFLWRRPPTAWRHVPGLQICGGVCGAGLKGTGPLNLRGWPSHPQRVRRAAGVSPLSFSLQAYAEQQSSSVQAFSSLLHVAAIMRRGGKAHADSMHSCFRCSARRRCARRGGKWPDRSLHVYAGLLANVSARTGPHARALFLWRSPPCQATENRPSAPRRHVRHAPGLQICGGVCGAA
jgi:hypothetical protein